MHYLARVSVLATLLVLTAGSCSSEAVIRYRDPHASAPETVQVAHGTLKGSTANGVMLRQRGQMRWFDAEDIVEIDHPGLASATVGGTIGILGALGTLVALGGLAQGCNEELCANDKLLATYLLFISTPMAVVGLGVGGWGLTVWKTSRRSAAGFEQRGRVTLSELGSGESGEALGLGLHFSF